MTLQTNPSLTPIIPLNHSTPLGVYQASLSTIRYQPTHGQNGRRQSLLKGAGLSPLHPSLSMLPATLLQHLKAMPTATNARVPLQMTTVRLTAGGSNKYEPFVSLEDVADHSYSDDEFIHKDLPRIRSLPMIRRLTCQNASAF